MAEDIDHVYKVLKHEHDFLIAREKELMQRIDEVKRLRETVASRRANVKKLEADLQAAINDVGVPPKT